jgi:HK97 family phage portal protein
MEAVQINGEHRVTMATPPLVVSDPFGGANSLSGRFMTRKQGLSQIMVSLLLRGNAYCWVVMNGPDGRPELLQVLHPDAVDVEVDRVTGERVYKVLHQDVPSSRVVHIMALTQPGAATGMSVIQAAQRGIGLGIAAEEYGARFFGSGAHLSGVITSEADMDNDQARQLAERFAAMHSGMANAHKVGVLSGGAKWAPLGVPPEEAQFLATRAAQNLDIAMLYGIPPHMLGQVDRTTSWGKGIEEQTLGFLKFTVADWTQRLEDCWSAMMQPPWLARFNFDELLRPDASARWSTYQIARNIGAMTIDEIRAKEGRANLPDGVGADAFAPLNSAHANDPGWNPTGEVGGPPAEPVAPPEEAAS